MNARPAISISVTLLGLLLGLAFFPIASAEDPKPAAGESKAAAGETKPAEAKPAAPGPQLTDEQKARLAEADKLHDEADELYAAGKPREAVGKVSQALAIRRQILGEMNDDTLASMNNVGFFLKASGDVVAAKPYYEKTLQLALRLHGEKHADTARSFKNLGFLRMELNDFAGARDCFEKALAIYSEVRGEKDPETATSQQNLGFLLQSIGEYKSALQCFEQALAIRQEVLDAKDPMVLESLSDMGAVLMQIGEFKKARPYCEQALALRREVLGEKDRQTLFSLKFMGDLLLALGDLPGALQHQQQALALRKEVFGDKNFDTIESLCDVGSVLSSMGDYAAARPYYEQALASYLEIAGEKHPATVTALNNLGMLLKAQGEYEAARPLLEKALSIVRELYGEKNVATASQLNSLATLLDDAGDYAAAKRDYEEALEIDRKTLGEKHPVTAQALNNLAHLLQKMGDLVTAARYYEQALRIDLAVFGENHRECAAMSDNLGQVLQAMGDNQAAAHFYTKALQIRTKVLGDKHPLTATSMNNLGLLYQMAGQYDDARPLLDQALTIHERVFGENHPSTATDLNNLGLLLQMQGNYAAAKPYYERSLAIDKKLFGENNAKTADELRNLGTLERHLHDSAAARSDFQRALDIRREVLGDHHPDTARSHEDLSVLLANLGDWPEAASHAQAARQIIRTHIARVLPGLSEPQQLNFLNFTTAQYFHGGCALGLYRRDDPLLRDLSAAWLINGKAVGQDALAQRALSARDAQNEQAAEYIQQLRRARRQLARLSVAQPQTGQEKARREQLSRIEQEVNYLERELTQSGNQPAAAESWIELDAVRHALDPETVLIEIAKSRVYDVASKEHVYEWLPARYAAWIIPPAGQGDVRIVDLGQAKAIDEAVAAARRTFLKPQAKRRGLAAEEDEDKQQVETAFREAPANLAALVLHPILEQIGSAKRLIISPDAALWLVPWGALPLSDGRYAIEQYPISYVISGRDLVAPRAPAGKSKSVVMADPDFDLTPAATLAATEAVFRQAIEAPPTDQLALRSTSNDRGTIGQVARLPGTAKEAKSIAPQLAKYAGGEPTLYLERYALEGVFKKLSHPKVVVLSTHGFFLADQQVSPGAQNDGLAASDAGQAALAADGKPLENPLLRCGLLLAGCNQRSRVSVADSPADSSDSAADDGILTGMEIIGTDLRGTELVVLSACETGLGEVHNGEGVAGLRQAFQLAGAEAVIASLWQVPDEQTAELMGLLFADLADQQSKLGKSADRRPSKAEALRKAQMKMIETHKGAVGSEPFYWAAFTLTGR